MLKGLLLRAYNPKQMYNMKLDPASVGLKTGTAEIDRYTLEVLYKMSERIICREEVMAYFYSLNEPAQRIFAGIVNKDLRIGAGIKTINTAFPGLVPHFEVQLCSRLKAGDDTTGWISPKLDGFRGTFADKDWVDHSKPNAILSRTGKQLTSVQWLMGFYEQLDLDPEARGLTGELTIPGYGFDKVQSMISARTTCPMAVFNVFDVMAPWPIEERIEYMRMLASQRADWPIRFVDHHMAETKEQADFLYTKFRKEGYEGTVRRKPGSVTRPGRNTDWGKRKPKDTFDLPIVGYEEGTGKYTGMLGALVVEYKGQQVRVGTGFSDEQRREFYENPPIGRTAEIDAMEETHKGSLRHPVFCWVREDK